MTGRIVLTAIVGSLVFLAITLFEQIPVAGWLGAFASLGAWVWLAGEVRRNDGNTIDAALVGSVTGVVGAVSAWLLQVGNLFGPDTPGMARFGAGFGTVGATVFLIVWPIIGALVCGAAFAMRRNGRRAARSAGSLDRP